MRSLPLVLALLTACGPTQVAFECLDDEPLCTIDEILERDLALASGVSVTKLSVNQAAEVILAEGEALNAEGMATVEGRDALFRVWVQTEASFQARTVVARLFIYQGAGIVDVREAELALVPDFTSDDDDVGSTFLIRVPGSSIVQDMSVSIELVEADEEVDVAGSDAGAVWPSDGALDLPTDSSGPALTIYMVPVRYDADRSGRTPPTDEAFLQEFVDAMYAYYPTPEVEFIVGEPMPWSQTISPNGQGFDTLLMAVGNLRGTRDDIPPYAYIYGYFQPADSAGSFCAAGCVAGLSNLSNSGSIGLGYSGQADTMVHEVGHAHGRSHSPGCGAAGADPGYPYNEGGQGIIGTLGYNLLTDAFYEPSAFYDVMSYCSPYWLSDFTFEGLFQALEITNSARTSRALAQPWRVVWALSDGSLRWGPDQKLPGVQAPALKEVELLDAEGNALAVVEAAWDPFDHLPGGLLRFPAHLDPGAARVRVDGRVSDLR